MKFAKPTKKCLAIALSLFAVAMHADAARVPPRPVASAWERLERHDPTDVLVIAHRGCWRHTQENSLAALAECGRLGADGIEIDVRHTRDGVAVLMHDDTVDRTTNGTGRISELLWKDVAKLRLRSGNGGAEAHLTKQRVPTLSAILSAAKRRGIAIVFDVKDGTQPAVFVAIRGARFERQSIFFYECRNTFLLKKAEPFRGQVVLIPIMFEGDGPLAEGMTRCKSIPAGLAHVKYQQQAWLDAAGPYLREQDARVWVATMFAEDVAGADDVAALKAPASVWGRQIDAGAVMIMTDRPQELIEYLRVRKSKSN